MHPPPGSPRGDTGRPSVAPADVNVDHLVQVLPDFPTDPLHHWGLI